MRIFLLMLVICASCSSPQAEKVDEKYVKESEKISDDVPQEVFKKFEENSNNVKETLKKSSKKKKQQAVQAVVQEKAQVEVKKPANALPINRCNTRFPFKIGEKIVWDVNYFLISAGSLTSTVQPVTTVNDRPVIHFRVSGKTYPKFSSMVYRANDFIDSYVDLENFISYKMEVTRDEKRVKGKRVEIFDQLNKKSYFWQVQDHVTKGHEEKKFTAKLEPGALDAMSTLYYVRCLDISEINKEYYVPIHTEGKNRVAWVKVERKEKISTDIGEMNTIVLRTRMILNGVLQARDAFEVWFSDDARKIPLQLKVKVKIGSVYAEIMEYKEGTEPLPI